MMYRCITIDVVPGENILPKIYKILNKEDKYFNTKF